MCLDLWNRIIAMVMSCANNSSAHKCALVGRWLGRLCQPPTGIYPAKAFFQDHAHGSGGVTLQFEPQGPGVDSSCIN